MNLDETIQNIDEMLELQRYKKDEANFKVYQASGFCLFVGNFRQYCKKHKLYPNIVKLP